MKVAVLFAFIGAASCLEVSLGGRSYLVGPENLAPPGSPVSHAGVTYYVTDADLITQMPRQKMMDRNMQEFSIGGVSYFVEPEFAATLVGLPASEQIARIQEAEMLDKMPRMMDRNMQEFSIGGVSYFVEPEFAAALVGLPASEQIALIQEAEMMEGMPMERMPRMLSKSNMKEVSIDGVSYFVAPQLADTLVGLPASEQLSLIQRTQRTPRTFSRSGNLKEVSIGGISYFVAPQLADTLVGRPAAEQLALIHGTQRMPRILTRGVAGGNMQELSIGGISYFVEPQLADTLVGLPASEQLARIQGTGRVPRFLKKMPATITRSRTVRSLAGKQEINIDGLSYFVDKNFARQLASIPRGQQVQLLKQIKSSANRGTSYGY